MAEKKEKEPLLCQLEDPRGMDRLKELSGSPELGWNLPLKSCHLHLLNVILAITLLSSPKGKETAWGNTTWFRHRNTLGSCGVNSTATHLEWEMGRFVVPESSSALGHLLWGHSSVWLLKQEREAGRVVLGRMCWCSKRSRVSFGDGKEGDCAEPPFSGLHQRDSDECVQGSKHRHWFMHLALNQKPGKQAINHGTEEHRSYCPGLGKLWEGSI